MPQTTPPAPAAPHPPLPGYYGAPIARVGFLRQLFDDTAPQYDRINRIFSLGTGGWYRRKALARAGLRPGQRVLDVAVGTGLVAREAVRLTGEPDAVLGLDPSGGMLAEARRHLPIPLIQGRAEALPLPAESIDFLSMGYALRHVADLDVAFAEFHRVLRPGGTVLLLEIGRPDGAFAHAAARTYLGRVVPALSRLTAPRAGTLMGYYWDTIEACVPAATILRHLSRQGFAEVRCETALGLFRAYTARRPGA
ncbi:class I SAM-dependent methyltransferase [Roseomonas sp. OT10]|uniref:class I SAM-dependent methyltransferase n=1 Tax=Roseomonas cutis TaxID=2897332 RepID=UPI001E587A16|nr:class I SAM-dependent methyltransferase [Roseomonas sp. OT10]UFN48242.1 class I SAM-dependent methyltransferase [Roseomonas sp. OT10]